MLAFGSLELTTTELPSELQFRVDTQTGGASKMVLYAFIFLVSIFTFRPLLAIGGVYLAIGLALIVAAGLWMAIDALRNWNKRQTATLSVTSQRLEATGDNLYTNWAGAYCRPGKIVVPVSEIKSLGYQPGGRYSLAGFWAVCGFLTSRCLLPGLSRQQCTDVTVAIVRRFPEIGSQIQPKN